MSQDETNILYRLGELSGKMDGISAQFSSLSAALINHVADDSRVITQIRTDIESIKSKQMYHSGGIAVVVAILMLLGQFLLGKLIV